MKNNLFPSIDGEDSLFENQEKETTFTTLIDSDTNSIFEESDKETTTEFIEETIESEINSIFEETTDSNEETTESATNSIFEETTESNEETTESETNSIFEETTDSNEETTESATNSIFEETTESNEETTESKTNSIFEETTNSNEESTIATVSPGKFDMFLKILGNLTNTNETIIIKNNIIIKSIGAAIAKTDLGKIFEKNKVSFEIINPKKYIKLMKQFKNNSDIVIINDNPNSRYIFVNNEIRLFIPKQDDSITNQQETMPNFKNVKVIANRKINKEIKEIINKLAKDVDYIEFLFKDNIFKGIHIPDTAIYIFEEYMNEKNKIDENNADLILRSSTYCPISAENYNLNIAQFQNEDKTYCLYTVCENFINIDIYEELEETTNGSFF